MKTALLVLVMLVVAGCSSASHRASTGTVLTLVAARDIGFDTLLQRYNSTHPGTTVQVKIVSGTGGDLAVTDDYGAARLAQQSTAFADLAAGGRWGDWALPVGVDGLGICYERHLFASAGLPTDRRSVAALWPTWDDYLEAGQQFEAAKLPAHWVDSALSVYDAVLAQQNEAYYRADGKLSVSDSAGVKTAWRVATGVAAVGESAQLRQLTPQWMAAAQSRRFATLPCPSWMLGWMKRNVPDLRGDWDVTTAPGHGGALATYYLVVPKSGAHVAAARELAAWLAAPAQQLASFQVSGILPASAALRAEAAVRDRTEPFVNSAPIGEIFTTSVYGRSAQPVEAQGTQVRSAVEGLVTQVDGWKITAAVGWAAVRTAYPA